MEGRDILEVKEDQTYAELDMVAGRRELMPD